MAWPLLVAAAAGPAAFRLSDTRINKEDF